MIAAVSLTQPFDRIVAEHQGAVLRVCRAILRDEHLGADAAQETFVRLFRALRTGVAPERAGAWLERVAVRVSIDVLRRGDARATALSRAEPEPRAAEASDPAAHARSAEIAERFERALATLSERQRSVFQLRHAGGLTLPQVAELLGIALPTAKTQFARACLKLQAALRPFDPAARRGEDPSEHEA